MTDAGFAVERSPVVAARSRRSSHRVAIAVGLWTFALGNVAVIVGLWWHGGNATEVHTTGDLLTSIARITGLLGAYLALVQVVLLARLPWLERLVGFDRLTHWHRWNGHAALDLVLAHVFFSVWGYAELDKVSIPKEIRTMLGGGIYPGMITATIGTALFVAVGLSSIVIARRRLRYEWWYAVHVSAYAAIALAWFHQIPTGNELVLDRAAADYWRALYAATEVLERSVRNAGVPRRFIHTERFAL
jgi:predicted ferric reductase